MGNRDRKIAGLIVILAMMVAGPTLANEMKIPNDSDIAGPRVSCDVAGWAYDWRAEDAVFDDTGGFLTFGPLEVDFNGVIEDVVLELNIYQTWIGDLVVYLWYDEDGNGSYDYGPVAALCRPALDGCGFDGCCGCSGNIDGVYTFGDDGAAPMGEADCPTDITPGCFQAAFESVVGFAEGFFGAESGGGFYLQVADGAGGDDTYLYDWGVYVLGAGETELTVLPDGTGDVPTIQDAVDLIVSGGTVYLGDGVFTGPGNNNIEFLGKEFTLRSQSLIAEACVIDCGTPPPGGRSGGWDLQSHLAGTDLSGDRDVDARGLFFGDGEGPGMVVRGLTIMNGAANFGGGIYIEGASPTIQDVIIRDCTSYLDGAGAHVKYGSPTFERCFFHNNFAYAWGGGMVIRGVGTFPSVTDCNFVNNDCTQMGGAIDILDDADPYIAFCQFRMNDATWGGAITVEGGCTADIRWCTITENTADWGGGIYAQSDFRCWFNIISYGYDGGAFAWVPGTARTVLPDVACCDFFGNVEGDWTGDMASLLGVDGNFSLDPEYCGQIGTGNLQLQSDSPCLGANNDCAQQVGSMPQGCGTSASRPATWSEIKTLY